MKWKLSSVTSVIILFFGFSFLLTVNGQKNVVKTPALEEIVEIYDVIFPKFSERIDFKSSEYSIDVRIDPSFGSPSQLSLIKHRDGAVEMIRFDFLNRKESLFEQLITLPEYGQVNDFKFLAKKLKVERKEPKNTRLIKLLINTFFNNTSFRKNGDLSLDGNHFEIWYKDAGSTFYFSQSINQQYDSSESKLVTFGRKIMKMSE
jgi:hypothetical protein